MCGWSLAAVPLWAARQRHGQPWAKGAEGGWPTALLSGQRFSLSPAFAGRYWWIM